MENKLDFCEEKKKKLGEEMDSNEGQLIDLRYFHQWNCG